ncbi:MAG: hypothetical protein H7648_08880, partial [Candidatus Heimdallarchaeota archaeon]|nr:hypothetical protein [Candidatus Heimdallarchaeota archaeon]
IIEDESDEEEIADESEEEIIREFDEKEEEETVIISLKEKIGSAKIKESKKPVVHINK